MQRSIRLSRYVQRSVARRERAHVVLTSAAHGLEHPAGCPALGWRHRRHYDMRATFIALAIDDGADPDGPRTV
ncbi:MAG TPA: hypothetical protein VHN14_23350 [Kofleriaceae bacterium]|jgi:hypothetical protein|nr:hypothetical protein [Kofleriaceae bacterium]